MSIGFPLAPAKTGLSSAIYAHVQVRFRTRRCSGNANDSVPTYWVETIDLADVIGTLPAGLVGKGTFVCKSDALALFNVGAGTPSNQTALHSLAIQIATDILTWRTVSHDITFNGIITSPPNGIMDTCQWTILGDEISTRQITEPINFGIEEFQHNDPANADCKDVIGQLITSKTPCIETYIPKWGPGGSLAAYRSRICLEDGRLQEYYSATDPVICGCGGGQGCTTGLHIEVKACNQSTVNGGTLTIKDQHGSTLVLEILDGTGIVNILSFTCDPASTYTINISQPGFDTINQVISVTCCRLNSYSFFLTKSTHPTITVNFHVAGCVSGGFDASCNPCGNTKTEPGISGVTVGVTVAGSLISCTTNANGDCTINFPVHSNGAVYPVSASGGTCVLTYTGGGSVTDTCLNQTANFCLALDTAPSCNCFCCENPRPSTLFLSDSVYGAIPLVWNGFVYTGTRNVAFPGGCGCPAASSMVTYNLGCNCSCGAGGCDVEYSLQLCYTAYNFTEFCGFAGFLVHDCPGPIDPLHPANVCIPAKGCAWCGTNILQVNCSLFLDTTSKCGVPFNSVFSFNNNCASGLPCGWHGIFCPSPWIGPATFTVTE